jgi:dTDP-4-dehydrorhamnose reductase
MINRINYFLLFFMLRCFALGFADSGKKFLIFGAKGWIGGKLVVLLKQQKHEVYEAQARLEDRAAIIKEIERYNPDFVINAAGVTGRPNVDWCEDHQQETMLSNITGAFNLAHICWEHSIHMTNFGTGCIYEYDAAHPMGSGIGFKEEETPNFDGSFYSKTKIILDKLLQVYPNVLNLRLRMPISDDLSERNFITKITRYKKVVNIPNSMSILTDLLPIAIEMALRKITGAYNFVNPGTISHNEILELYKHYIDPNFTYENFTVEEQNKILKSKRSNNELDVTKLLKEFPELLPVQQAIIGVFERMQQNLKQ